LVLEQLRRAAAKVGLLDGDTVRQSLSRGLGFSRQDRDENIQRIGFVCNLLTRNGVIAIAAAVSRTADLIPECKDPSVLRTRVVPSLHDGVWWAKATAQFNFRRPDALDAGAFNRLLWRGIKGEGKPYPGRSGVLRHEDDDDTPR
jgi:hypothetical protein